MEVNNNFLATTIHNLYEATKAESGQGNGETTEAEVVTETPAYELDIKATDDSSIINPKNITIEATEGGFGYAEVADGLENMPGDELLAHFMDIDRKLEELGWKVSNESMQVLGRYFEAIRNIKKGTKSNTNTSIFGVTFGKANLGLAGIALAADAKQREGVLSKHIAAGHFTMQEYTKANDFAAKLQNKAGVLVETDLGFTTTKYSTSVKYSYNDSLVKIGLKELNFMADHSEAMDIWTDVAKGKYKNHAEIIASLQENGYSDIASAYSEHINSAKVDALSEQDFAKAMASDFTHSDGALTSVVSGYSAAKTAAGNTASQSYSTSELKQIISAGKTAADDIWNAINSSKARNWYLNAQGVWVGIDA